MSAVRPSLLCLLPLALTACPSAPSSTKPPGPDPTGPVASVTVTGPANNALKLNEATQLTATAKDAGGKAFSGKTFAWTSSDPAIATVDTGGNVTAKRFGTVTVSAAVDGISGSSAALKTYGLEAVGGTSVQAGSAEVSMVLLVRFRDAAGGGANSPQTNLSLAGPSSWNGGSAYTFTQFFDGISNYIVRPPGVKPVTGDYTLSATISGAAYRSSFRIADATQTLAAPGNLTLTAPSSTGFSASWSAVPGATRYGIDIYNDTEQKSATNATIYQNETGKTYTGLALEKAKSYAFQVAAYNALICCDKDFADLYPAQFNEGRASVKINLP